jgi:hypothetical protein
VWPSLVVYSVALCHGKRLMALQDTSNRRPKKTLCKLGTPPNIVRLKKRRMNWVLHLEWMWTFRNAYKNFTPQFPMSWAQWPRGLRRRSVATRLLGLWVQMSVMDVCCECCVLSGRGLCDGLITRPGECYRLWRVWVWSRNLVNEEAMTRFAPQRHKGKKSRMEKNHLAELS